MIYYSVRSLRNSGWLPYYHIMGRGKTGIGQIAVTSRFGATDSFTDVLGEKRGSERLADDATRFPETKPTILDLSNTSGYKVRLVKRGELFGGLPVEVNLKETQVEFYVPRAEKNVPENLQTEWGRLARRFSLTELESFKAGNSDMFALAIERDSSLMPTDTLTLYAWLGSA
jgi:hypothetical protein